MPRPSKAPEIEPETSRPEPEAPRLVPQPAPAPPPPPEDDEGRTLEKVISAYDAQPHSYRENAKIFRADINKTNRQGDWIFDYPAEKLDGLREELRTHPDGGKGVYQVVLQDALTKLPQVRGIVRIAADGRQRAPAAPVEAPRDAAIEILREQLALMQRRVDAAQAPAINTSRASDELIDKLNARLDDLREKATRSYHDGYEKGFAQGQRVGIVEGKIDARSKEKASEKDPWTPDGIAAVMREAKDIFKVGGASVTSAVNSVHDAATGIIDVFRQAVEAGMSAAQTVAMLRVLRGRETVVELAKHVDAIVVEARANPAVEAMLAAHGQPRWLDDLQATVHAEVVSPGAQPG